MNDSLSKIPRFLVLEHNNPFRVCCLVNGEQAITLFETCGEKEEFSATEKKNYCIH